MSTTLIQPENFPAAPGHRMSSIDPYSVTHTPQSARIPQTHTSIPTAPPNSDKPVSALPAAILAGVDTLEIGLFVDFGYSWSSLREHLLDYQMSAPGREVPVKLGGQPFALQPRGRSTARFQLIGSDLTLLIADNDAPRGHFPNVRFELSSHALWSQGWIRAADRWLDWIQNLGMIDHTIITRVDLCADLLLSAPLARQELEDGMVTQAPTHQTIINTRTGVFETLVVAKNPLRLQIYDKLAEASKRGSLARWISAWGWDPRPHQQHVWRVEFQLHRAKLKKQGVATFEDLRANIGALWAYLTGTEGSGPAWFSLRTPSRNAQRTRWPLHPVWLLIQQQAGQFGAFGQLQRNVSVSADPSQRIKQMDGLLKSCAAMYGILNQEDALAMMCDEIRRRTSPEAFKQDVTARMLRFPHSSVPYVPLPRKS